MVDIGHDRVERALDKAIEFCREENNDIREVYNAGKKNPVTKIMIAIVIILLAFQLIYPEIMTRTVIVKTDTSVGMMTQTFETKAKTVDEFMQENAEQINYVQDQDIIDTDMAEPIMDEMIINIKKAIRVTVVHDGTEDLVVFHKTRVRDALQELGLSLGPDDLIEPSLYTHIYDRDQIVIKRITKELVQKTVKTKYKTIYKADPSMTIGKVETTQKGRKGVKIKTYEVTYEDGVEISRELVKTERTKKKKDKIISYGTKILSGKPAGLKYQKKLSHVRAVSYWFSGNPHGAYGLKCEYGTCAVDKSVIPLGSLIYVEGYGYAIANDVGSGVKGKTVDLYMEKLSQCGIWGARWVNVYIIRYGP